MIRAPTISVLCVALCIPLTGKGSAAAELDTRITEVVLHPKRAEIKRTARRTVAGGVWRFRVSNLPSGLLNNSVRASVRGGEARIVEVRLKETTRKRPPSDLGSPPQRAIDLQQRGLAAMQRRQAALAARATFLDAAQSWATQQPAGSKGSAPASLAEMQARYEFVTREREKLLQEQQRADDQKLQMESTLAALQQKAKKAKKDGAAIIKRKSIHVTVEVTPGPDQAPVNLELAIRYRVEPVRWEPDYRLWLHRGKATAALDYGIRIWQDTGEDWRDARLTLTTAAPDDRRKPPPLHPTYVFSSNRRARAAAAPAEPPPPHETSTPDDTSTPNPPRPQQWPRIRYPFPQPVTIESGSTASPGQVVTIARLSQSVQLIHEAHPKQSPVLYTRAELRNTSDFTLLPGTVSRFLDNVHRGEEELPLLRRGAAFMQYLGAEPTVLARRGVEEVMSEPAGFFSADTLTDQATTLELHNRGAVAAIVDLRDPWIKPGDEEISSSLRDLSVPRHKDKAAEALFARGILQWRVTVPPGRDGAPGVIRVRYITRLRHRSKRDQLTFVD